MAAVGGAVGDLALQVGARQPRTALEDMHATVLQESALLQEELARLKGKEGGEDSAESVACLALLNGLRAVMRSHNLPEVEAS